MPKKKKKKQEEKVNPETYPYTGTVDSGVSGGGEVTAEGTTEPLTRFEENQVEIQQTQPAMGEYTKGESVSKEDEIENREKEKKRNPKYIK